MGKTETATAVAAHELSSSEAVRQCMDNLMALNGVIADVFSRIDTRLQSAKTQVRSVVARTTAAQLKVRSVAASRTRQVTTLYAAPKYPVAAVLPAPEPVFPVIPTHSQASVRSPVRGTAVPEAPAQPCDVSALFNELSASHDRERAPGVPPPAPSAADGLGGLPDDFASISGLLLFNTTHNPYRPQRKGTPSLAVDPLAGVDRASRAVPNANPLSSAPVSVSTPDAGHRLQPYASGVGYKPSMPENRPSLAFEQKLSLPGIVVDLNFVHSAVLSTSVNSIAPSVVPASALPSSLVLPSFDAHAFAVPTANSTAANNFPIAPITAPVSAPIANTTNGAGAGAAPAGGPCVLLSADSSPVNSKQQHAAAAVAQLQPIVVSKPVPTPAPTTTTASVTPVEPNTTAAAAAASAGPLVSATAVVPIAPVDVPSQLPVVLKPIAQTARGGSGDDDDADAGTDRAPAQRASGGGLLSEIANFKKSKLRTVPLAGEDGGAAAAAEEMSPLERSLIAMSGGSGKHQPKAKSAASKRPAAPLSINDELKLRLANMRTAHTGQYKIEEKTTASASALGAGSGAAAASVVPAGRPSFVVPKKQAAAAAPASALDAKHGGSAASAAALALADAKRAVVADPAASSAAKLLNLMRLNSGAVRHTERQNAKAVGDGAAAAPAAGESAWDT